MAAQVPSMTVNDSSEKRKSYEIVLSMAKQSWFIHVYWRFPSFATKAEFFPLNGVVESPTGVSLATQPGCLAEDVLLLRYIYIYI